LPLPAWIAESSSAHAQQCEFAMSTMPFSFDELYRAWRSVVS
jgi:hypothetical protein